MRRGYRGGRRNGMRPVIQSMKYVVEEAPAALAAAANNDLVISTGEDAVAAGQSSVVDTGLPTGSIIKAINIDFAIQNLVLIAGFYWLSIQLVRANQAIISPRAVGGNPQRNQVFFQAMRSIGQQQNGNFHKLFKIPGRFQRVRDGDEWHLVVQSDVITTQAAEFVYKFYR